MTVEVHGTPVPLDPAADLVAYRVIQEGLTNAIKHLSARAVRVRLDWTPGSLDVLVLDPGPARTGVAPGARAGLVGMDERVRAAGGWLRAGPDGAAGFTVAATLPAGTR